MQKTIVYVVIGLIVGITIHTVSAWVEPDQMPPGGNIAAPLNTGNTGQSKIGGLIIALGEVKDIGLAVINGKSGFGTGTPTERVDVNGNIKLNGRIIGLQAPTDANDAVNKGYVDALGSGGGGTYEAYNTTSCAPGWTVAYTGLTIWSYDTYSVGSGHWCMAGLKEDDNFDNNPKTFVSGGAHHLSLGTPPNLGSSYTVKGAWWNGTIPCAVCVK